MKGQRVLARKPVPAGRSGLRRFPETALGDAFGFKRENEVSKKLVTIPALILFLAPAAALAAEDTPKAEVFGGYSYFRPVDRGAAIDLHGWNASVGYNVTDWLGVVGDFSGHYGDPFDLPFVPFGIQTREHFFLGGPRFSARSGSRLTPFAQALFGGANSRLGGFGIGFSRNAFAMAAGGGLDYRVGNHLSIRLVQADYVHTRFGGDKQNNVRLSAGVVWRIGSK